MISNHVSSSSSDRYKSSLLVPEVCLGMNVVTFGHLLCPEVIHLLKFAFFFVKNDYHVYPNYWDTFQ